MFVYSTGLSPSIVTDGFLGVYFCQFYGICLLSVKPRIATFLWSLLQSRLKETRKNQGLLHNPAKDMSHFCQTTVKNLNGTKIMIVTLYSRA